MPTSFSTNLALALPATGELSGTWGTTVNSNITNMLDEALGYQAFSATGGSDTLTIPDGTTGVARSIYIQLDGTGGGTVNVPATKTKMYFVFNNTASAITFKVTGQTGVSIPAAAKIALVSNGTDIITAENYFSALTLGAALPVASGGTAQSSYTDGQLLIGNTSGNTLTKSTLTAGANIAITNGNGSITIAATGVGVGDVVGPASATNNIVAAFDGTTGKLIKAGSAATTTVDGTNLIGYKNIPYVTDKTTSYSLAVGDVGEVVGVGTGGSITIPDATFAAGDAVLVFNNTTGDITVTCTITTAYIAGTDADVASVTLSTRGVCNILFISGTVCVITGNVS